MRANAHRAAVLGGQNDAGTSEIKLVLRGYTLAGSGYAMPDGLDCASVKQVRYCLVETWLKRSSSFITDASSCELAAIQKKQRFTALISTHPIASGWFDCIVLMPECLALPLALAKHSGHCLGQSGYLAHHPDWWAGCYPATRLLR